MGQKDLNWEKIDWKSCPRKINDKGYVERLIPSHPYAQDNWVLEHRLAYEDYLGRYLAPAEIIHHANEIKDDNRIDNLFLTDEFEHTLIHKLAQKHSQETRKKMRRRQIGRQFKRDEFGKFA